MTQKYRGDPEGRRLARARATMLSEAGRVARLLETLLGKAGENLSDVQSLSAALVEREQRELLLAHGRIESRKRFKYKSGQPLHDNRRWVGLYIDESGQSHPNSLDPVVAVAAVAMTRQAASRYVREAIRLKERFFGRHDFTFHEPQIRRHEELYSFGGDAEKQRALCEALDRLVEDAEFVAFGVGIRKAQLRSFLAQGTDPYLPSDIYEVAIDLLMERFVDHLATQKRSGLGLVTFESQGPKEDAIHQLKYTDLLLNGTQWVPDSAFRNWLETGVRFVKKQGTHPLELSDMLARDLYEWAKSGCTEQPRRMGIFNKKIYRRGDLQMGKFGVKVFPDLDIRMLIEAHRTECDRD